MKYCHSKFFRAELVAGRAFRTDDQGYVVKQFAADGEEIRVDDFIPDGSYFSADSPEAAFVIEYQRSLNAREAARQRFLTETGQHPSFIAMDGSTAWIDDPGEAVPHIRVFYAKAAA